MTEDKLPRGHAYIRMRNRGYRIDIDWPEWDSDEAERMMRAVMKIATETPDDDTGDAASLLEEDARKLVSNTGKALNESVSRAAVQMLYNGACPDCGQPGAAVCDSCMEERRR